ncbi:MAG TPA: ATP-binding cassette domain-containing protein [Bacillota bacterium]|nr:ATP-binding cassette domain-containing protein [Bacillota bacterium]
MIEIEDLSAGYGHSLVLRNLYLKLQLGEVVGITGCNGAGKTTLLKVILGLIRPEKGSVTIQGRTLASEPDRSWARKQIGYVPQLAISGKLPISVHDAALMGRWGTSYGYFKKPNRADREKVTLTLTEVGLAQKEYHDVRCLSGGEQQKLAIARALVRDAAILLLDEPTTYLDRNTQADLVGLLEAIRNKRKMTVIVISHDPLYLGRLAKRIFLIDGGCLKEITDEPA